MLVMSIVNIPLYVIFGFNKTAAASYGGLTLGNMGQGTANCATVKLGSKGVHLSCMDGTITDFTQYGVYTDTSEAGLQSMCSSDAGFDTGLPNCAYLSTPSSDLYTVKLRHCLKK